VPINRNTYVSVRSLSGKRQLERPRNRNGEMILKYGVGVEWINLAENAD
jgi:ribosomal protein L25 (general stress protein Ctc)